MNKKYRKQLATLISLVLLFSLTACSNQNKNEEIIETLKPKIKVINISSSDEPLIIETKGIVKPIKSVTIKSLANGTVINILVKQKDKATISQSLAYLFNKQTEIDYLSAWNSYNKALNFYNNNLTTNKETLKQAQNYLQLATTNLDLIATNKSKQNITSGFAGIISDKMIEIGDKVNIGQELFEISIVDYVKIEIPISAKNINFLSIGDKVTINDTLEGILNKINPLSDPASKEVIVEIKYNNSKFDLIPENSANIKIPLSKLPNQKNIYIIPLEAVNLEENIAIVKIIENNKIVDRIVEYLQIINDRIIINKGLGEGEQIATGEAKLLSEGTEVEVLDY